MSVLSTVLLSFFLPGSYIFRLLPSLTSLILSLNTKIKRTKKNVRSRRSTFLSILKPFLSLSFVFLWTKGFVDRRKLFETVTFQFRFVYSKTVSGRWIRHRYPPDRFRGTDSTLLYSHNTISGGGTRSCLRKVWGSNTVFYSLSVFVFTLCNCKFSSDWMYYSRLRLMCNTQF